MEKTDRNLVIYEIKVPSRRSRPETIRKLIDTAISKVKENSEFIDLLNVPEIIDENFEGRPFYRSIDVVPLSDELQTTTGKNVIINKVVGHLQGNDGFVEFLNEIKMKGIGNIVLVGVLSPHLKYPGLFVPKANKIASEMGFTVGNICIPNRPQELERIITKTESGCNFFTTQILLEEDKIKKLILDYDKKCKENGIQPARIFLSFATIEDGYDIEFFKWLGIEILDETEKEIQESSDMKTYCEERIKKLYKSILKFKKDKQISVPLGVNISQVNVRNLDSSLKLTKELSQIRV